MPRAIWSGTVTFGLVSIPVGLYSATSDHTVHFHQLERGTADRIRNRRVNERTGEEVDRSDIVKGYELDDGQYVVVEPEELAEIAPGRSRTLEISTFVSLDEIDPVYFDRTYWVAPASSDYDRVYRLLWQAMAETERAGIATFVMHGKEYLTAVRAGEHGLVLETMFFADEIRDPGELESLPGKATVRGKELDMATSLIESMSGPWNPEDFRDTYTAKVQKLVRDKKKGKAIVAEAEPPEPTGVVDLMEALRRSVEKARKGKTKPDLSELRKSELDAMARELDIKGRSKLSRAELEKAVRKAS
ncbi:non-homologous end joining protein Ku [Allokutzneria albata]|uniref:Non-homologous end joining protein Ku n=1 Tax=Allokutzneria albata TaxID=211114 RepID=A0A1G9V790_ALLAB|nr:Ku protein [Allokutzneria albata]SDM67755.1 DNA end-binding protein Ku [Allokutzneria albata]